MTAPNFELQTAIYSALNGVISCAVYDHVPQGTPKPYVTLDTEDAEGMDFLDSRVDRRTFYLGVWSDYAGQKEVKTIMSEVDDALTDAKIALSSGRIVTIRVGAMRSSQDADGVTYMGQIRLDIITQH